LELLPEADSRLLLDEEAPLEERRVALERVRQLSTEGDPRRRDLVSLADALLERSTWIIGGDGWAYDIGYGGLDHILAGSSGVRVLVLDTEVYSNTGGQSSKSTPLGAVAKFAAGGKATAKKDLGLLAMAYGTCYVASIAMGANEGQTIKAFQEAESFPGPAIILAYSQCIAHGIDMAKGMNQQKLAVESGAWLLYRYDPRRREQGLAPLQLDSKAPSRPLKDYMYNEGRFRILANLHPEDAAHYYEEAQVGVQRRWKLYQERALQG
jgi:pyruvate-ferredoxin/flavodoxin oxidoreductase